MPHTFNPRLDPTKRRLTTPDQQITINPLPPAPTRGLRCCLCDTKPAWWIVEHRAYCAAHKAEAYADAKRKAGKLSREAVLNWKPMGGE